MKQLIRLWIVAVALAGCTLLTPVRDRSRFFLLTPMPANAQTNQEQTHALILGMGPVKLPDYLKRSELATRVDPGQVQFSDIDRWAEPLSNDFPPVLSEDLSTQLGNEEIVNLPSFSFTSINYQIAVNVERFECDYQRNAHLVARWAVINPVNGQILYRGQSDLSEPRGGNVDQDVAALSRTLADFSRQIATAVRQVSAHRLVAPFSDHVGAALDLQADAIPTRLTQGVTFMVAGNLQSCQAHGTA
jgi:uncharacterized protein